MWYFSVLFESKWGLEKSEGRGGEGEKNRMSENERNRVK